MHLDFLVVHAKGLDLEIYPDCRHVLEFEFVIAVAKEDVGLAHARITQGYQFHDLVVVFFGFLRLVHCNLNGDKIYRVDLFKKYFVLLDY